MSSQTTHLIDAEAKFPPGFPQILSEPPNARAASCRWQTRFARLVRRYGVARLAHDLEVDPAAIYQWVRGSVSPRPDKAMLIVVLLQPVGRLRLEDIYSHRLTVQANARLA
jgi:hypothetical protein